MNHQRLAAQHGATIIRCGNWTRATGLPSKLAADKLAQELAAVHYQVRGVYPDKSGWEVIFR